MDKPPIQEYMAHHGILGQKWGTRNGPPYPLGGGDYTQSERKAILKKRNTVKNSIYNKRHFDEVLKADKTTLSTLSYDTDRTKGTDMFYATHNVLDIMRCLIARSPRKFMTRMAILSAPVCS